MAVPQPVSVPMSGSLSSDISRIIDEGQVTATGSGSALAVLGVSSASMILLWAAFTPLDWAPLAFVALVPLAMLARIGVRPRRSLAALWSAAFIWSMVTLHWLRLGHPAMIVAQGALSVYMALYFPVFVVLSGRMVRSRIPVWLAVPLAWTALEFARAHIMTGFSWYYLGHTQYRWTSLVQISDLTGAWGVSFIVALSSGAIAAMIPNRWFVRLRLVRSEDEVVSVSPAAAKSGIAVLLMLVVAACVYGELRTAPTENESGPMVAVVQGNFEPEEKADQQRRLELEDTHLKLTWEAALHRPGLIVWPETMYPHADTIIEEGVSDSELHDRLQIPGRVSNSAAAEGIVDHWRQKLARKAMQELASGTNTPLMVGLITRVHDQEGMQSYNSAALFDPQTGYKGRYDKIHRVVFGEYVPLKDTLPFLAQLVPPEMGDGLDAGTGVRTFESRGVRYAPVICFEDTVPHLMRQVALGDGSGPRADVLVNLTNDAWFRGSSELDQHLITSTFRCIEARRPMVRAVNGGISAFIDSSGRIREPETIMVLDSETKKMTPLESMFDDSGNRRRQMNAMLCGQIPLDGRSSLYLAWGDWFPILCTILTAVGLFLSRMQPTMTPSAPDGDPQVTGETAEVA